MGVTIFRKEKPVQLIAQETALVNPMLAAEGVLGQLVYPLLASPKYNGVRGSVQNGKLYARSLKPIPNHHTSKLYSNLWLNGVDGELVVGNFADEEVFTKSTSGVMSIDGKPDVRFYLFDMFHQTAKFMDRIAMLEDTIGRYDELSDGGLVFQIQHKVLESDEDTENYANEMLALGYEGLVLRHPLAKYKNGRSTASEQGFMRFCPWFRSEALILSFIEGKTNLNESVINELGFKKKSSHQDKKVGINSAGAMVVRDLKTSIEFKIPTTTEKLSKYMWEHQDEFLGKVCKYKFKPPVKIGGKPRFPQYEGLRSALDMS